MATFNKEDLIKWNDLATSLQDIIMRKITWDMLHPDLQAWLLDKERRIIELERWRRGKADPMLDDHEARITTCEGQITSIWSKLKQVEDDLEDVESGGGAPPVDSFTDNGGWYQFPNGLIIEWGVFETNGGEQHYGANFPKAFPHKSIAITLTDEYTGNDYYDANNWYQIVSHGNSSFVVHLQAADQFRPGNKCHWIAIGY